jgi:hypothetical protein
MRSSALILLLVTGLAAGCSDDGAGDDSPDTAPTRPERDAGAGGEDDPADATPTDSGTALPQDFEAAWQIYFDTVLDYSVGSACPCFVQLGFESSIESCRNTVQQQLTEQLGCLRFALSQNEGAGIGYMTCDLTVYEPAIACQQAQTEEPDCLGGGDAPCPLNEALQSDCLLLLGEEQRQSVEGCAPEEEEEFP